MSPEVRQGVVELLIHASEQLHLCPIVKYTALSFFADRFLPSLRRESGLVGAGNWLLNPLRESNLQLFSLISLWVSSKIHDSRPLSVKSLKALGEKLITDQHFTTRDFAEAEIVFMEVLRFNIAASNVTFIFLEDLLIQFRELSKLGELVSLDVCMEIMDLLYETEETSMIFTTPYPLAASILVTAYIVTIPKKRWEFPLLPWVKFATSYEEDGIREIVQSILRHILKKPSRQKITRRPAELESQSLR